LAHQAEISGKTYEVLTTFYAKQTQFKPNTNPIKPNLPDAQMSVNSILTKDYERNDIFAIPENKPKTNPNKPCPEHSEFTLSVIEGNGPISNSGMLT
jgi:hypothetical protein